MCGINGLAEFSLGPLLEERICAMNQKLTHRGPDAKGIFIHNNTALGHTRLSIIDLNAHANQPFYSTNKNLVMVYNGEVYNYKEIQQKYNIPCQTSSDTEVILKAFELVGPAIFNEFNGMFALAIFDKTENSLIIARDKMGIKPLFIFQKEGKLAFSSELNALKAVPELKNRLTINKESIGDFLHLGYIPGPKTIYNELQKFPSGSFGIFQHGEFKITAYWKPEEKINSRFLSDEKKAIQQLDNLLNNSVKLRLNCDVPFGTFLSGGIDSSLVSVIAQQNSTQKIDTFSIGFKEKNKNEAVFAKRVAEK